MKTITRSLAWLMLLIGLAVVVQAQNPAVRMSAGPGLSVNYSLKNLGGATIAVGVVELQVFDAKTCKKLCATKSTVNKKIAVCQTLDGQIRCPQPVAAPGYIYFLRVRSTGGTLLTENWLFVP